MKNKHYFRKRISALLAAAMVMSTVFTEASIAAPVIAEEADELVEIAAAGEDSVSDTVSGNSETEAVLNDDELLEVSENSGEEALAAIADENSETEACEAPEIVYENLEEAPILPADAVLREGENASRAVGGTTYTYESKSFIPSCVSGGSAPNYQSGVRNQSVYLISYNAVTGAQTKTRPYPNNTCWAFSAMAAAEASAIKAGADASLDLSERALTYYTYNNNCEIERDPIGTLEKDKDFLYIGADVKKGKRATVGQSFAFAGSTLFSVETMAMGMGLTDESKVPYSRDNVVSSYDGTISRNTIPVESKYKFDSDYYLKSSRMINMKQHDVVKQMILQYGGVSASINYKDAYLSRTTLASTGASEYFYSYTSKTYAVNHDIVIVGWDDDVPAACFTSAMRPAANGAWLCKNSYGANWSKFTIPSNNGYFWLSYATTDLETGSSKNPTDRRGYVFELEKKETSNVTAGGNRLYQYDGSAFSKEITDGIAYANVYTAKKTANTSETEYLRSVMAKFATPNSVYSVQLYENPTNGKPESGTPILKKPVWGEVNAAGYYDIPLGKGIALKSGSKVSVVVRLYPKTAVDAIPAIYSGATGSYTMTITPTTLFPANAVDGYAHGYYKGSNSSAKYHSYYLDRNDKWNDFVTTIGGCPRIKLKTVVKTVTESRVDPSYEEVSHYQRKTKDKGTQDQPTVLLAGPDKESGTTRLYIGQKALIKLPEGVENARWSSDKPEFVTVDQSGIVTAVSKAKKASVATIIADVNGVQYKHRVSVINPYLVSKKMTLNLSDSGKIGINGAYQSMTFESAKPDILEVDANTGAYVARGKGSSKVTVTAGDLKMVCTVKVTAPKLSRKLITLAPEAKTRAIEYVTPITIPVDFVCDNPAVCSVDASGNVTAVGNGKATIICTVGNYVAKQKITVVGF